MQKIRTFLRYVSDYLKFGEFYFLMTSIIFILTKKVNPKRRVYNSSLGTFITRKGTLDFQFFNYAYEWNVKRFFLQHYSNYSIFFDIGANVGTYSFMMAGKGLRVHAFEPIKDNIKSLILNVMVNGMDDKITVHPFGLGNENSEADFIFETMNTGASHLATIHSYVESKGELGIPVKAEIRTLDSVLPSMQYTPEDNIFIKIDAEGMEINVLEGSREFIRTHPHFLIVMESKHSGAERIKAFLKTIGNFIYMEVDEDNLAIMK